MKLLSAFSLGSWPLLNQLINLWICRASERLCALLLKYVFPFWYYGQEFEILGIASQFLKYGWIKEQESTWGVSGVKKYLQDVNHFRASHEHFHLTKLLVTMRVLLISPALFCCCCFSGPYKLVLNGCWEVFSGWRKRIMYYITSCSQDLHESGNPF